MQVAAIAASIVIARSLGPAGKGLWTYAVTILAAVVAFNGQPAAIAWQYAKRHRTPAELTKVATGIVLTIAAPLVVALASIGLFVPGQHVLLWVAAAALPALFARSAIGFFLADCDAYSINVREMISSVGFVVVAIPLLLILHGTFWELLTVWVLANVAAAAYAAVQLRQYASIRRHTGQRHPVFEEQLRYAVRNGSNALLLFLNFRIDVFIVIFMLGQSALGVYSIGLSIGELLWQLGRSPASFGEIAGGDEAEAARATVSRMRHCFALTVAFAAAVAILAPAVLPVLYGRAFTGAVTVTWLLLPGIVAYSMMRPLTNFFTQQLGKPRFAAIFRAFSILVCAGTTIALIPRFGIAGGAIGTSISYLATFVLALAYFVRRTGIAPLRFFYFTKGDLLPYRALFALPQSAKR